MRFFERLRTGYRLTVAGEGIIATAPRITELTRDTERRLTGAGLAVLLACLAASDP